MFFFIVTNKILGKKKLLYIFKKIRNVLFVDALDLRNYFSI